ncbi:HAD family acid phosphatase [Micromonospora sp. CPCC 206061]|uniref:HAD family acid phosphatase n=1 Tax=Micromonospora sp. CPCC 206061 TaxID=3122410 RepID=UPI002FEF5078
MRSGLRRGAVVVAAILTLVTPATAAQAAALPSYETWIADVTVVADTAESYLATRLPDPRVRAAIVLDIDNTALVDEYSDRLLLPATTPILEVARQAKAAGAAVFFVTNRPEIIEPWTEYNLDEAEYPVDGLYTRPTFDFRPVQSLKTSARTAIEQRGYTIVANIGNNDTDLVGGHAERTFKLPDYNGQLS